MASERKVTQLRWNTKAETSLGVIDEAEERRQSYHRNHDRASGFMSQQMTPLSHQRGDLFTFDLPKQNSYHQR